MNEDEEVCEIITQEFLLLMVMVAIIFALSILFVDDDEMILKKQE